jgi:acetolactate synthase-1/2/3 large subunit
MPTGGELIVAQLRELGVDRIFTVPGESFLAVLDALHDAPSIDLIVCRHEAAAATMAEAHGKLTGRPGVCLVTRGPGATHASIGVHTARHDSTPMLLLVGQVARAHRGRDAFQEVELEEMFAPLAKGAIEIDAAARAPEQIAAAHASALEPRRGPVVISLPEDMLTEQADVPLVLRPDDRGEQRPAPGDVARVAAMLDAAERPLVLVGGGIWDEHAAQALAGWAEASGYPIVTTFRRQDYIDNTKPAYVGYTGVALDPTLAKRIAAADVILALGTRLADVSTGSYTLIEAPNPKQTLIHVYPDATELGRVFEPALAVVAEPRAFAHALAVEPAAARDSGWAAELRSEYEACLVPRELPGALELSGVVAHLRESLPETAILANGAGNFAVWGHRYYQFRRYGTQLAPTSGAMGYGLPAAIAAKLAHPDVPVVALSGDGDFMMSAQELATAVQYETPVVVLVVNNGMFGTIRMHQEREYPGRVIGTGIANPDFVALAQSFGAYGELVESTEEFSAAFARALEAGRPAVLELHVDPEALTPRATLSEVRGSALAGS